MNKANVVLYVKRIESYTDGDGNLGRVIELVERRPQVSSIPNSDDDVQVVVSGVTQTLQRNLPMIFQQSGDMPKIFLLLTELEIEALGIKFEVNKGYEVTLAQQSIIFKASTEPE